MGRFSNTLRSRMLIRQSEKEASRRLLADFEKAGGVIHPNKYPNHLSVPTKGAVFGGTCNTTRCNRRWATNFNFNTYGYYCDDCASGMNRLSDTGILCVEVEQQLTLDQMNAAHLAGNSRRSEKRKVDVP